MRCLKLHKSQFHKKDFNSLKIKFAPHRLESHSKIAYIWSIMHYKTIESQISHSHVCMFLLSKYAACHNDWELGVRWCMKRIPKKLSDARKTAHERSNRAPSLTFSTATSMGSPHHLIKVNVRQSLTRKRSQNLTKINCN